MKQNQSKNSMRDAFGCSNLPFTNEINLKNARK